MVSTTTSILNNNFGGIRRKNSFFSNERITCSDCQNIELYFTKLNSGIGIRTAKGNVAVSKTYNLKNKLESIVPKDENIIGIFESFMDNDTYFFVYTENQTEGKLYTFNITTIQLDLLISRLEATGRACGESFTQGWLDMFIFSNGVNVKYLYCDTETKFGLTVSRDTDFEKQSLYEVVIKTDEDSNVVSSSIKVVATDAKSLNNVLTATVNNEEIELTRARYLDIKYENVVYYAWEYGTQKYFTTVDMRSVYLEDTDGRKVKGLGLKVFDSRLWIFDGKVLWYSQQADCRVFNFVDPDKVTSSGYMEFVKPITAIYPYLGSLAVFHENSSVLVQLDETTMFKKEDESPGGCASYDSLVFHGTDLYFYDNTKKGVFSFQQIVNGDKTLGENIAEDVQEELMSIGSLDLHKIRTLSVVTSDRNEVWFLVPISQEENRSIVLIYDYVRGEWVKRKSQSINCIGMFDGKLYSAGKDIYEEYVSSDFDGEFIRAYYTCSIFNLGADNTLKITKFPPRVTCDGSYKNHFWVKYVKNYNPLKSPKIKEVIGKTYGGVMVWDSGDVWDGGAIYQPTNFNASLKLPSATFKALEMELYTTNSDEDFCIKSIEYSKIKVKQI